MLQLRLPPDRARKIKLKLDAEFRELAYQFTKGRCSTIPSSTARQIYDSLLYTTDIYLLNLHSDDAAVHYLLDNETSELLRASREYLTLCLEQTKRGFREAWKTRLDVRLPEYRYVMDKAFDEFLNSYSPRFNGRSIEISIDYPLLGRRAYELQTEGIMYVREYYACIAIENRFCRLFTPTQITGALKSYAMGSKCNADELSINICEAVLHRFLEEYLANPESPLPIDSPSTACRQSLCNKYSQITVEALRIKAAEALFSRDEIHDDGMMLRYLTGYISQFAQIEYQMLNSQG